MVGLSLQYFSIMIQPPYKQIVLITSPVSIETFHVIITSPVSEIEGKL
jgi:hypothetical protein